MAVGLFVGSMAIFFALLFLWSFRTLPREGWQIIASVPVGKTSGGQWNGLNLTYYGFFIANSSVLAAIMGFVLLRAIDLPITAILAVIGALFLVAVPSARLVAGIVEKKANTFTIAGASFVGLILFPAIVAGVNYGIGRDLGWSVPIIPTLATTAIAYAYGEGMGRLACISFGCCYGKPVDKLHPTLQRLFNTVNFKFSGETKKVAYEGGLEGIRVIPIQAITAVIYILIALIGTTLFLTSHFAAATAVTVTGAQTWRSLSEILRADYRGKGKISRYQIMAVLMIFYVIGILIAAPAQAVTAPSISEGLLSLWNPLIILAMLSLWVAMFLYTGRSRVTGSVVSFLVHLDRI